MSVLMTISSVTTLCHLVKGWRTNPDNDTPVYCVCQVGTSSVVYPAAMFAPELASRGVTVAEFNVEQTPATGTFSWVVETVHTYCSCVIADCRLAVCGLMFLIRPVWRRFISDINRVYSTFPVFSQYCCVSLPFIVFIYNVQSCELYCVIFCCTI